MSVGPRIVFACFASAASPKLRPWAEHVRRVVGELPVVSAPSADTGEESAVVWHLVSANNRPLARGAGVHGSFEDAAAGARGAIASISQLEISLVSEQGRGFYGWYLAQDGAAVVTCARWYFTDRDRRHSIDLTVKSMEVAVLHEGARLMNPTLMMGVAREPIER